MPDHNITFYATVTSKFSEIQHFKGLRTIKILVIISTFFNLIYVSSLVQPIFNEEFLMNGLMYYFKCF